MDFIENLRKWASGSADKVNGQENVYHMSSGKNQKEYEQDADFYKEWEEYIDDLTALALGPVATARRMATSDHFREHYLPWIGSTSRKD